MELWGSSSSSSSTPYEEILEDLCRRMKTSNYYTTKSSPWFLRGVLVKYEATTQQSIALDNKERIERQNNSTQALKGFQPKEFTDVLVSRLAMPARDKENNSICHNNNDSQDNDDTNCDQSEDYLFMVATALLQADPSKYLSAITTSLSNWVSSFSSSQKRPHEISRKFLQFWISLITDDSIPLEIHDDLCNGMMDLFQQQQLCTNESSMSSFFDDVLKYATFVDEPSLLSVPTIPRTTNRPAKSSRVVRQASFFIRFLSRCSSNNDGSLVNETLTSSGVTKCLIRILENDFEESSASMSEEQLRQVYLDRLRLLDVLLEETRNTASVTVTTAVTTASSVSIANHEMITTTDNDHHRISCLSWIVATNKLSPVILKFFRDTMSHLTEAWKEAYLDVLPITVPETTFDERNAFNNNDKYQHRHRDADIDFSCLPNNTECATGFVPMHSPPSTSIAFSVTERKNSASLEIDRHHQVYQRRKSEIVPNAAATEFATRFVRYLARVADPMSSFRSSRDGGDNNDLSFAMYIDKTVATDGMALFTGMLTQCDTSSLQQLRLVRLLMEEFATPANHHKSRSTIITDWLSSTTMRTVVLKQFTNDPFLWDLPEARWYLETYLEESSSVTDPFQALETGKRPLRAAPPCHRQLDSNLPIDPKNNRKTSFRPRHVAEATKRLLLDFRTNLGWNDSAQNTNTREAYRFFDE